MLTNVGVAENPLLQALKNGALIEERDMYDIFWCPDEIVDTEEEINDETGCGMEYTDEKALIGSYGNLLEGSKTIYGHLSGKLRQVSLRNTLTRPSICPKRRWTKYWADKSKCYAIKKEHINVVSEKIYNGGGVQAACIPLFFPARELITFPFPVLILSHPQYP